MHRKADLFIIILGISAGLIFLAILLFGVSQRQGLEGLAYKSLGCNTNKDCPELTSCKGGTCVLVKPVVTQAPLSYVSLNSLEEKPTPIPTVYDRPTPTPKVDMLEQLSTGINNAVVNMFNTILNLLGNLNRH